MVNMSKSKERADVLNLEKRTKTFEEVELTLTDEKAKNEALRCLNCKTKPCVTGCPVGVDIPSFIKCVATNDIKSAYEIILKNNAILRHNSPSP